MKIKGSLISAIALTAVLGMTSLGTVNADDSSNFNTDNNTQPVIETPSNGTSNEYQYSNNQGNNDQQYNSESENTTDNQYNTERQYRNRSCGQNNGYGRRENGRRGMYNSSCTNIDDLPSKNITTEEK